MDGDKKLFYCYVVCVNDGFYREPDITIDKVFLSYEEAKKRRDSIKKFHRGAYIEKRKLIYDKK